MSTLRSVIVSALTGATAALFAEKVLARGKSVASTTDSRVSRKVADIAPSYATLERDFTGDSAPYEVHRQAWVAFVREAVQPGLTELEAREIAQAILEYEPPAYNYAPGVMRPWERGEGNGSR